MTKEEAWAAFAEQYNHRMHGPSDAFKFAWNAATKAEREACAKLCDVLAVHPKYASDITKLAAQAIRARGDSETNR